MDQKPWKEIKLYDKEKLFTLQKEVWKTKTNNQKAKQARTTTNKPNQKPPQQPNTHTNTQILFSILFMEIICD